MPREDRRLVFDYEEVYKALYGLCAQKQISKPPAGRVQVVGEDKVDGDKVFLELENPHETTAARVEYSRDFLAAALMVFCRGCGIPLPRNAKKSVLIKDGQVMLRIQI